MPSDCKAYAAAWYGLWDSSSHAGLPWECMGSVSAWKPRASQKFPLILECRACFKKACPNMADRSAHVQMRILLGGQAAGCAVALWVAAAPCPPPGQLCRQDLRGWQWQRHCHCVGLLPSPDLRASARSARRTLAWGSTPSCVRAALPQQMLTCEAEFTLKKVICA